MGQIQERFGLFLDKMKISNKEAEERLGLSNGQVGKMIKGSSFGVDTLEKICKVFPELNINWLVTGVGDMIIEPKISLGANISKSELKAFVYEAVEVLFNKKFAVA